MDDTQQSRASEAATRKRRSSILKSHRAPRTPFCELEFNVTTPPDTTKSRRVSFSRRTGVAEFATNEATTTWKNFYEEHNKSLESSGNDSGANGTKQTVSHLGKRFFEEQFEVVEDIDFTARPSHGINISNSINNVNFTLENTDKLPAPENNFDLSAFTEQRSKVFVDDLAMPCVGEVSDKIDVNFSAIQKIGENDDLDEIQKDIQRQSNVCHGHFNERQNMSDYIEVDLDMTHVPIRQDESDMSITDMIRSPKVQDVSKSVSIEKKVNLDKDWVTDKENIAINPYVAPRESLNFALNEDPDKVLVFDGKKLIIQTENSSIKPEVPEKVPQRKTIVLNCDDDLPNFVDNSKNMSGFDMKPAIGDVLSNQDHLQNKQTTILYDDDFCNISMTKAVCNDLSVRRRTVLYDNDTANISVTQAVPLNIIENPNKTRTVVFESDNGNISVTKAISGVLIANENKEKTLYENEVGDISVTQALPLNIMPEKRSEKRKTILFDDNNISMTEVVPNILIKDTSPDKTRTIVYENETGNISVTQVISTNMILIENKAPNRRRTVIFEKDTGNISVTQTVPSNILMKPPEVSDPNISMNQGVSTNIVLEDKSKEQAGMRFVKYNNQTGDISVIKEASNKITNIPPNKIQTEIQNDLNVSQNQAGRRRTVVFNHEDADISVTQAVDDNQLIPGIMGANILNQTSVFHSAISRESIIVNNINVDVNQAVVKQIKSSENQVSEEALSNKRRTIVFDNNDADLSLTQAVSVNKMLSAMAETQQVKDIEMDTDVARMNVIKNRRGTIMYENDEADVSMTQAISANIIQKEKRQTIVFDDIDISMTQAIPANIIAENKSLFIEIDNITNDNAQTDEVKAGDVSMKEADPTTSPEPKRISTNLYETENAKCLENKSYVNKNEMLEPVHDIVVYQAVTLSGQSENCEECNNQEVATENNDVKPKHDDYTNRMTEGQAALNGEQQNDEEILKKEQESVMEALLDMGSSAVDIIGPDNEASSRPASGPGSCKSETTSYDSLFYITNDKPVHEIPEKVSNSNELGLAVKASENINNMLSEIKTDLSDTDKETKKEQDNPDEKKKSSTSEKLKRQFKRKSFNLANDTGELLEILSDFTGNQHEIEENATQEKLGDTVPKEKQQSSEENNATSKEEAMLLEVEEANALDCKETKPLKIEEVKTLEEEKSESIQMKNNLALEDNPDATEPPSKANIAPRRMSVALSREDLFHNLSMATAALQKSRMELDDSEHIEDISNDTLNEEIVCPKKTVRMSASVVKTLTYDDDTSDLILTDTNLTLKKTAFGEVSYMKEAKTKVIPDYTNACLGVKELLDDLVKPMADVLPYDAIGIDKERETKREASNHLEKIVPSTCSTQIQANLITSSQIDLPSSGVYADQESTDDFSKMSSSHIISEAVRRSLSRAVKSPISTRFDTSPSRKSFDEDAISEPERLISAKPCGVEHQGNVLIFDHNNPLNNVLLAPPGPIQVHKYNPSTSGESISLIDRSNSANTAIQDSDNLETDQITQYCLTEGAKTHSSPGKDSESALSSLSKPSVNRAIEAKHEMANVEVNTVIAMRGNNELLNASSSLTLVDDARYEHDECMDSDKSDKGPRSPVKVIFEGVDPPEKLDSDFTSNDELANEAVEDAYRAKKRIYSPAQRDKHMLSKSEVTPKPVSKMAKISSTPEYKEHHRLQAEKDEDPAKKRSPRKHRKPGTDITVQQLLTEYKMEIVDQDSLKDQIMEVLTDGSESPDSRSSYNKLQVLGVSAVMLSSCSSKNMESIVESSRGSKSQDSRLFSTKSSRVDWQEDVKTMASKNTLSDCDSGVNVVAKIDMMPFMGSPECEWESCNGDRWSFRLLHGRLRLVLRLKHRHDNAPRSFVRANTPVLQIGLEVVNDEHKSALASLCVRFAAETMRWAMRGGCAEAGEAPALLARVAAAARAALRWARAMHHARARLAFALAHDGTLSLKVANIPLRSVWEVTMQIELSGEEGCAPYPRATGLCVRRVLADCGVTSAEALRATAHTPPDWGHAPRTIWKIFRYLKNKTQDDILS